jgi:hypothetical protein
MMKSRKRRVLVVTALVALVAMVVAATALAGVWKKEGVELKEKTTFSMTGGEVVEIESGASALSCNTTVTMTTSGGSSGSVTAFAVNKSTCEGVTGKFVGCTVSSTTPKTLPWTVTVGSTTLTVKNAGVKFTMNAGCSISSVETSFTELTLTPEPTTSAISFFRFGQTATGKVNGVSASVTSGGTWLLPESQAGIYGIG